MKTNTVQNIAVKNNFSFGSKTKAHGPVSATRPSVSEEDISRAFEYLADYKKSIIEASQIKRRDLNDFITQTPSGDTIQIKREVEYYNGTTTPKSETTTTYSLDNNEEIQELLHISTVQYAQNGQTTSIITKNIKEGYSTEEYFNTDGTKAKSKSTYPKGSSITNLYDKQNRIKETTITSVGNEIDLSKNKDLEKLERNTDSTEEKAVIKYHYNSDSDTEPSYKHVLYFSSEK